MAITHGITTIPPNTITVGDGSFTASHTQMSGADGIFTAFFSITAGVVVNSVTYDGNAMTQKASFGPLNDYTMYYYTLQNPPVGTYNFVINTNTAFSTGMRVALLSIAGGTVGDVQLVGPDTNTPITDTHVVGQDNALYMIGVRGGTWGGSNNLEVDNIAQSLDWEIQHTYEADGAVTVALNSGSRAIEYNWGGGGNAYLISTEIISTGGAPPPPTRRRGIIIT